jgi:hypothetical protein
MLTHDGLGIKDGCSIIRPPTGLMLQQALQHIFGSVLEVILKGPCDRMIE